jgi:cell division protein FtsI (penicillin-binding protein 3)/stage V sporulation protein D (sporulation-specific penicillin-binding protein)
LALFTIFGLLLLSRLFFIQIIQGDFYRALAQGLHDPSGSQVSERGEIYFRNGEPLAINMEWPLVFASPRQIAAGDKEATAEKVAQALNLSKAAVLEKLNKDNLYELLKKRLTESEVSRIKELALAGINLDKETGRYYPENTMASQVVGFLDAENQGQYGLEEYYDDELRGNSIISGSDLVLTLDQSIQFMAEKLLEEAKDSLKIEAGEIVVMDPTSGEILAMANYPNFNPNQYSQVTDFDVFQNGTTQKLFEPGSVFKPLTMAVGLEEGKITPQTTYQDAGMLKIGGYKIFNYDQRKYPGDITMTEVLEKSINTGAVFAQKQIGNDQAFLDYLDSFGIFKATGVDLNETFSENKELKKGYEINFATAAFGQGVELTSLQMIKAYSALTNGGKMVIPHLAKEIRNNGYVSKIGAKTEDEQVVSAKTASQVTAMLVSVIENGFSKKAKIPGYYLAGKTGTAQIAWSALNVDKFGYSDKTYQSFIGFAPAFNPQFLIMVKLKNPQTNSAEYSAMPLFRELAKYIIDYYQIPPDYKE